MNNISYIIIPLKYKFIFEKLDFNLLIVHTEADFMIPLRINDQIAILLKVEKIGKTSFTLNYIITNLNKQVVGKVNTIHVCVDKDRGEKKVLPEELVNALQLYL